MKILKMLGMLLKLTFHQNGDALADLKFTADSDNNILVMNASGILLARINVWLDTTISDDGSTIHQGSTFSFQDANYQQLASYNSYEREENDLKHILT